MVAMSPSKEEFYSWYVDQAPTHGDYFLAVYTPFGIQDIDMAFCEAIMNAKDRNSLEIIRKDIEGNIHLHSKIKENLCLNVDLRLSELS